MSTIEKETWLLEMDMPASTSLLKLAVGKSATPTERTLPNLTSSPASPRKSMYLESRWSSHDSCRRCNRSCESVVSALSMYCATMRGLMRGSCCGWIARRVRRWAGGRGWVGVSPYVKVSKPWSRRVCRCCSGGNGGMRRHSGVESGRLVYADGGSWRHVGGTRNAITSYLRI